MTNMAANPRPKTPNLKDDNDMSDENVYNTLLKSWNNVLNTPKTKIVNDENLLNSASSQHFVTPTKITNFNMSHYQNDNIQDKNTIQEDNLNYNDMILNPMQSYEPLKRDDEDPSRQFPFQENRNDLISFDIEKSNSTNDLSLNPKVALTAEHMNKSISVHNIQTINPAESKSSAISNNDNNLVSKNKLSIYKQFKRFNWNELTPKKSGKERKMSFESNTGINFINPISKTKSLLERSDSITQTNGLLSTPLLNQDLITNYSDSGSLRRPQVRSNGSQVIFEPREDILDNSPFDDTMTENIFNSDALKRRSLNPRSSFSSSLDVFNLHTGEVLNGTMKTGDDAVFTKNLNLSRSSSITSTNKFSSNFREIKYDYLNSACDGNNNFTTIMQNNNKESISPSTIKHMTPPLLSKRKSSGLYNYQTNSHLRSTSISMKSKVILLEIPYTNDNFDQVLGIAKIVNSLKKKQNTDIEWVLTMTYIVDAQEDILVNNMVNELKTSAYEVKKLIGDLRLKNDKDYLNKNTSQNVILKEYSELRVLNFDYIKPLKARLSSSQPNVYDLRSNTNSRYSSITTIHDGGEIIRQPIIGEISDDISTVFSRQSNADNVTLSTQLNAPYMPVSGSAYLPKHLTVRLYNYRHFNQKDDLQGYLQIMEKVFTNEEIFLSLWNNAMNVIDNDYSLYQEYNFRNKNEVDGIVAKIHFYKPSNEIQLVIDEYFTAYNRKKYDAFKRLSCYSEDEIMSNGGKERRGSYVDCYEILTKIYQGEKTTLYV